MVTINKAEEIALNFAKAQGEVLPGIYYGITKGREYSKWFYFDFLLVNKDGVVPEEPPMAGGAPGIVVDKESGRASMISFGELAKLV